MDRVQITCNIIQSILAGMLAVYHIFNTGNATLGVIWAILTVTWTGVTIASIYKYKSTKEEE